MERDPQQADERALELLELLTGWPPINDEYIRRYEAKGRVGKFLMRLLDPEIKDDLEKHARRNEYLEAEASVAASEKSALQYEGHLTIG